MGKLKKLSPKKPDNKQSKISLFFQAPKDASKDNSGKTSSLFTIVKEPDKSKSKLSLKKDMPKLSFLHESDSGCGNGTGDTKIGSRDKQKHSLQTVEALTAVKTPEKEVKDKLQQHDRYVNDDSSGIAKNATSFSKEQCGSKIGQDGSSSKNVKSVLLQASQIIKSITGEVDVQHPMKGMPDDQVTCVPETQLDQSYISRGADDISSKLKSPAVTEIGSDPEADLSMIPGTPQEKSFGTKKKSFRSFLTCKSELNKTLQQKLNQKDHGKQKVPPKQKKVVGRSLEDALKSVENDLEFASPETFNALVTGVGFGPGPIIPKKHSISPSDDQAAKKSKHRTGLVGCLSGVKRASTRGLSPNPKRTMRNTPPKKTSPRKENEAENAHLKSNKVRKFSRNLSTAFSKNIIKQDNFPKDSAEKGVSLEADDNLSDLLQGFQSDIIDTTPKSVISARRSKVSSEGMKKSLSPILPSHDEPDEALDDIISELRDTLTQSNSKCAKSKAKLENSILSEGLSPRPQPAKRRIPMDQGPPQPETKCLKSLVKSSISETTADEMEVSVDSFKNDDSMMILDDGTMNAQVCGGFTSKSKSMTHGTSSEMTISSGMTSTAAPEVASGTCDDLDMSDLQFDEAELALEESLQKEFSNLSPFKKQKSTSESGFRPEDADVPCTHFGRCKVKEVLRQGPELLLELVTDPGGQRRQARLTGFWTDVEVAEGHIVHIVGDFDSAGRITLSDSENLLIVHPDLLMSGTSVVSGIYCMRRAVLNERFKGYDSKNIHMLYGTIIHSFFQQVVQKRSFTPDAIEAVMTSVLQQSRVLQDMYGQGVSVNAVVEEIKKYVPQLQAWATKYLSSQGRSRPQSGLTITRIADIEENVWSPRYGIKGKIDLTVDVKIHDRQKGTISKSMPLELKTGRPSHSVEHKGQVTLYSMMSGDRRADPGAGLLLYLKDGSMSTVPAEHAHKRGLVQLRNELSHHMWRTVIADGESGLPRPINSYRSCSKCPQLINCAAYQRVLGEPEVGPDHAMSKLLPETLGHLSERHLEFYRHWIRLMMLELSTGGATGQGVVDLWCKTGWQREQAGLCLSGMALKVTREGQIETETGHFKQTFTRVHNHPSKLALNEVGLGSRENLVVSAENETLIALTMGTVTAISATSVTLLLDRNLQLTDPSGRLVYRLDKADTYNTMGTNMTNLARLMENTDTSARLREIVIEKKTPEFETTMSKGVIEKVRGIFKELNKPQKTAILKVLMCKDYVLIKGYPGTGKTSTIVSLVRVLVLLGRSVLLTSYTHSAVDNILLKLIKNDVDFVRLGRAERVHPDVQPYSAELQALKIKTVDELAQFYESKSVVATTCLGVGSHPVFARRTFDVCIVDEASQVLQPACLGPLYASRRFVLVGDPLQLPPVVQNRRAREGGMDESLFARLDDAGGTYELNLQYRMNAEIMRLSNELVYSGALRCGSETVSAGRLVLTQHHLLGPAPQWLRDALTPDNRIVFLDTSKVPVAEETGVTGNVQNQKEAEIIQILVNTCVKGGVGQEEVGVITPYRAQVALVRDLLQRHHLADVEVNTVDQYQGRDKNCIIVSFVKSSPGKAGGILEDMRRLNVALTRARHKLVLIGHVNVLTSFSPLRAVLDILHPHQILQLPEDVSDAAASKTH